MKIKTRLLLLIIFIILSITTSVVIFISFNRAKTSFSNEKIILQNYRDSIEINHEELFRFQLNDIIIVEQLIIYNKSLENKKSAFTEVEKITSLPKLDKELAKAIQNITNLEAYQTKSLTEFFSSSETLLKIVKEVLGNENNFILNGLVTSEEVLNTDDFTKLQFYVSKMKTEIRTVTMALKTSIDIIDEQYSIIDKSVEEFEYKGNIISILIFIVSVIFGMIVGILVSNKIGKSVNKIGDSLSIMSKGDLTHKIIINSSDEIGILSHDMDRFQSELNLSLNKMKDYSTANENIKEKLIDTATETAVSSEEISTNISSIDNQMNTLNNNILQSNKQVGQISSFTNELNNHVTDQMAMVEQSTASITQMIASISSVASLNQKNMQTVEILQETAKDGDTQITETTDRIHDINESVQNIAAMAEVIQNISEQTNLLSMNAAIEAAHAGDAGKGFAVVADEIRKLSEASAVSSKDIATNLKDIVKKFEKASISSIKTRDAFGNIYEHIQSVTDALRTVSTSTSELNIGGTQIMEAMDNLKSISNEVLSRADEMNLSAYAVKESIEEVSQISSVVTQAMTEVNVGFSEVRERITGLESISTEVGDVSQNLNTEISKFTTTEAVS